MAYKITTECTNCNICAPECPNGAITQGKEIYEIDPASCTECVGFFDQPQCEAVCPVEACITDPDRIEAEDILEKRVRQLHPEKTFSGELISHFRK